MDTIFALATAPGKSGVSVIRVSGPDAFRACLLLTGWQPHGRAFRVLPVRDETGDVVDRGIVLAFEAGASFTGEATVEFQLHGSPAIQKRVLAILGSIDNLRPADAGEFTRRALENDRLDLAQVEGLGDLIEAETELQRRQAMSVLDGVVAKRMSDWRGQLLRAIALIEATIDFADEDVPVDVGPEVLENIGYVLSETARELGGISTAERIRDGFEVAIVGRPNAGKSTLLNFLAGRDVAITSEIEGTTRDVLEVSVDLDGLPVTFLDTAGLRQTEDAVEALGVERAMARASSADLRVFLRIADDEAWEVPPSDTDLVLNAKADLSDCQEGGVSGVTGVGVPNMLARIREVLIGRVANVGSMTRQRHAKCLLDARTHLESARLGIESDSLGFEIVAEDMRAALRSLEGLTGHVGVEDVLGEIFSSFCIGK